MKVSKYLHSCFLVEENGEKLLFDPGKFTFIENKITPDVFQGINFIFITHAHGDHYDIDALKVILKNNPNAKIYCNAEMAKVLSEAGLQSELFNEGEREAGKFRISAFKADHMPLPVPWLCENTSYLVNGKLMHCGDSQAQSILQHPIDTIIAPVAGPFMTSQMFIDFMLQYKPSRVLPAHDAHIKDFSILREYERNEKMLGEQGIVFVPLHEVGDSVEI